MLYRLTPELGEPLEVEAASPALALLGYPAEMGERCGVAPAGAPLDRTIWTFIGFRWEPDGTAPDKRRAARRTFAGRR